MSYHKFMDPETGETAGSFEVFGAGRFAGNGSTFGDLEEGWYWWACLPGCLTGGGPVGPFETEEDAIRDANDS